MFSEVSCNIMLVQPFLVVQVLNRVLLECLQALGLKAGCSGIGGQDVPGGGMQQGFLNSDPWANWSDQRQAQESYN